VCLVVKTVIAIWEGLSTADVILLLDNVAVDLELKGELVTSELTLRETLTSNLININGNTNLGKFY